MCGATKQVVLGSFNNDHDDGKKKTGSLYDLLKKTKKQNSGVYYFFLFEKNASWYFHQK